MTYLWIYLGGAAVTLLFTSMVGGSSDAREEALDVLFAAIFWFIVVPWCIIDEVVRWAVRGVWWRR